MLIGYARVSKADGQDAAVQIQALKSIGADRIFIEMVNRDEKSGAEAVRLFNIHPSTVSHLVAKHR